MTEKVYMIFDEYDWEYRSVIAVLTTLKEAQKFLRLWESGLTPREKTDVTQVSEMSIRVGSRLISIEESILCKKAEDTDYMNRFLKE